jgi:hypothetical protein
MKRKRKKLVEEFEKLLQEVIPANYFFLYQRDTTIKLWWWCGEEPMIDINCGDDGYTISDFSETPLPILKVLVKGLTKSEKIKNKVDQRI